MAAQPIVGTGPLLEGFKNEQESLGQASEQEQAGASGPGAPLAGDVEGPKEEVRNSFVLLGVFFKTLTSSLITSLWPYFLSRSLTGT